MHDPQYRLNTKSKWNPYYKVVFLFGNNHIKNLVVTLKCFHYFWFQQKIKLWHFFLFGWQNFKLSKAKTIGKNKILGRLMKVVDWWKFFIFGDGEIHISPKLNTCIILMSAFFHFSWASRCRRFILRRSRW